MRFVCENCQTRYIIPDERARGRVLKVRCKKCSNVIVLRADDAAHGEVSRASASAGHGAPAEDETRVVDQADLDRLRRQASGTDVRRMAPGERAAPGPAVHQEAVEWHVIIAGQQLGPLPLSGLIERMASGKMSGRSYIWRDPMPEWKRAAEVGDVARWLPASKTPIPAVPTDPGKGHPLPARGRKQPSRPDEEADWEALGIVGTPEGGTDPAVESFFREAEVREPSSGRVSRGTEIAHVRGKSDPFARVSDAPDMARPEPSENTKFFITQAKMSRSPWRVAIFVVASALVFGGAVFLLSRLGVRLPLIPHREVTEERVFTGEAENSDPSLRDKLVGRRRNAEARVNDGRAQQPGRGVSPQSTAGEQGPLAHKDAPKVDKLPEMDKQKLRQLYGNQQLEELHVKAPAPGANAPAIDRTDAPLTPQQVATTVSRFQSGYNMCIDRELKRNPGFKGGRIRVVTTIMSSGLVKQAQLVAEDQRLQRTLATSPLGSCLTEQTRRMVFPNFQGEPFDAEIPLVLGAAL